VGLKRAIDYDYDYDYDYDVITLNRMLPGLDGLEVVTALRAAGVRTPVLMISALSQVDDRIRGLRAGGDDYLVKPFASEEMAARVEVLLRRHRPDEGATRLQVGDLELNMLDRRISCREQSIDLQNTEFKLIEFFMRNADRTVTRALIFETVWGYHFDPGTKLIDVHVVRHFMNVQAAIAQDDTLWVLDAVQPFGGNREGRVKLV
jgi:two-component system, OmpR family, response regulator